MRASGSRCSFRDEQCVPYVTESGYMVAGGVTAAEEPDEMEREMLADLEWLVSTP